MIRGLGVAALLVALLTAGCQGYSSQRLTDFPSARTIAIVPFTNTTFYRDLELRLSQQVANEIRARTNLGFASVDRADLLLSGHMYAREVPTVLAAEDGGVIQKRLEGWLEVVVTDRATGRVVRRQRVATTAEWREGVVGESLEGSATDEWTRRIAEQVAQVLERSF